MALPSNPTLGSMRSELRDRLGYRAQSQGVLITSLNSYLRNAQYQLYWHVEWKLLKTTKEVTVGNGQINYDYEDDCNPDRILSFWSDVVPQSPVNWYPMHEGIELEHYNSGLNSDRPRRFELRDQIEIWPPPDSTGYKFRYEYIKRLNPFTQDTHTLTVPDDGAVFLHALANAKAHYKQPDAAGYAGQLRSLMDKLRAKKAGNKVYQRGRSTNQPPDMVRPLLIE